MRRYVLTGTPGAGKTSILHALAKSGFPVVPEAATDVIAAEQSRGIAEPWTHPYFVDAVVKLQQARESAADGPVQVYDRSPVCTLALQRFLGHPESAVLTAEIERIVRQGVYQRTVFMVRNLGFVQPSTARRISLADALEFERLHEAAYAGLGFALVPIEPGPVRERASRVTSVIDAQ